MKGRRVGGLPADRSAGGRAPRSLGRGSPRPSAGRYGRLLLRTRLPGDPAPHFSPGLGRQERLVGVRQHALELAPRHGECEHTFGDARPGGHVEHAEDRPRALLGRLQEGVLDDGGVAGAERRRDRLRHGLVEPGPGEEAGEHVGDREDMTTSGSSPSSSASQRLKTT